MAFGTGSAIARQAVGGVMGMFGGGGSSEQHAPQQGVFIYIYEWICQYVCVYIYVWMWVDMYMHI
jgi:hypothetical protein